VCAALVTVLAAYALPHHHHGGAVCGVELFGAPCDVQGGGRDGSYGGGTGDGTGDGSHAPGGSHSDGDRCVAESEFVTPSDGEHGAACCAANGHGDCGHVGCGMAAVVVAAWLYAEPAIEDIRICRGELPANYTSVEIASAGPLRAPPANLC